MAEWIPMFVPPGPSKDPGPPKDSWHMVVDRAMGDLLWATGGVSPDDPMVVAWQALRDALEVSGAHEAWVDQIVKGAVRRSSSPS